MKKYFPTWGKICSTDCSAFRDNGFLPNKCRQSKWRYALTACSLIYNPSCWFLSSSHLSIETAPFWRLDSTYSSIVCPDWSHSRTASVFYPSCLVVSSLIPPPSPVPDYPPLFPSVSFVKANSTCTRSLWTHGTVEHDTPRRQPSQLH